MKQLLSFIVIIAAILTGSASVMADLDEGHSAFCKNENYILVVFNNEIGGDYSMAVAFVGSNQIPETYLCEFQNIVKNSDFFNCIEAESQLISTLYVGHDGSAEFNYHKNMPNSVDMVCDRGTASEVMDKYTATMEGQQF